MHASIVHKLARPCSHKGPFEAFCGYFDTRDCVGRQEAEKEKQLMPSINARLGALDSRGFFSRCTLFGGISDSIDAKMHTCTFLAFTVDALFRNEVYACAVEANSQKWSRSMYGTAADSAYACTVNLCLGLVRTYHDNNGYRIDRISLHIYNLFITGTVLARLSIYST